MTNVAARRRALLVVDVQNDFCEGGSLACPGGARLASRISAFADRRAGDYTVIVASRDLHVDPGDHFAPAGSEPDFQTSWPPHCRAGTPGADLHPDLRLPAALEVTKGETSAAYSAFDGHTSDGRSLVDVLDGVGVTDVDVCGIATSYCVARTALDAAERYRTRLLDRLCVDVAGADTAATLRRLEAAGVTPTGS